MKTNAVSRVAAREAMTHARRHGIKDLGNIALYALVQALRPEGYEPPTPAQTSSIRAGAEWHALRRLLKAGALSKTVEDNVCRFTKAVSVVVVISLTACEPRAVPVDMQQPVAPVSDTRKADCEPDTALVNLTEQWQYMVQRLAPCGSGYVEFQPCDEAANYGIGQHPYIEMRYRRLVNGGRSALVTIAAYESSAFAAARAKLDDRDCARYVANGGFSCLKYSAEPRAWCVH